MLKVIVNLALFVALALVMFAEKIEGIKFDTENEQMEA